MEEAAAGDTYPFTTALLQSFASGGAHSTARARNIFRRIAGVASVCVLIVTGACASKAVDRGYQGTQENTRVGC
ncbi:hypothetical protein B0H12DRAFT_1134138 [Mycena haematopus]|nr:hypothetical protein B0H12DRAFT_1134138 [Mycena haematopus]